MRLWPFGRKRPAPAEDRRPDRQYVYLMHCHQTGLYKIGISDDPERRRRQIQNMSGLPVRVIQFWMVWDARGTEAVLHRHLDAYRLEGEWFALDRAGLELIHGGMGQGVMSDRSPLWHPGGHYD